MFTFYQVDAFTKKPFHGNPACICVFEKFPSEIWMQNFAMEMNLSETAFVVKNEKGFDLRWFTPVLEVPLCGHATLASAHVLWEQNIISSDEEIVFHTKSGDLKAKKENKFIVLDFPVIEYEKISPTKEIIDAIGEEVVQANNTREDLLIELKSDSIVRNFKPDLNSIINLPYRGVIITARGESKYDFVSRFFVPKIGINEDPVTGSAHCVLSKYWKDKLNITKFNAYQASLRGGELITNIIEDRVYLYGEAITIFKGISDVDV